MKNKGIKIGVVFILLFALLSVAGCQQEDVVIVGAASGQPGPTKGQLRIGFTLFVSKGSSTQPSRDITINDLSLSADTSFTVTNTDTGDTTVLTGAVIDTDPTFTYVNFDEDDDILPASTRVSILISYTLEPGNYKVTAVTGSVKYPSSSGTSVKDLSLARDGDGLNTTFTIAAPELTPTPEPAATPTVEPTATPTAEPTATPTAEPTAVPQARRTTPKRAMILPPHFGWRSAQAASRHSRCSLKNDTFNGIAGKKPTTSAAVHTGTLKNSCFHRLKA